MFLFQNVDYQNNNSAGGGHFGFLENTGFAHLTPPNLTWLPPTAIHLSFGDLDFEKQVRSVGECRSPTWGQHANVD